LSLLVIFYGFVPVLVFHRATGNELKYDRFKWLSLTYLVRKLDVSIKEIQEDIDYTAYVTYM